MPCGIEGNQLTSDNLPSNTILCYSKTEYEKSRGHRANCTVPSAYAVTSMAAAAGKQDDGNDDQPKGAVIKQIAKTVIHNRSSTKLIGEREWLLCYHIMTNLEKGARKRAHLADF